MYEIHNSFGKVSTGPVFQQLAFIDSVTGRETINGIPLVFNGTSTYNNPTLLNNRATFLLSDTTAQSGIVTQFRQDQLPDWSSHDLTIEWYVHYQGGFGSYVNEMFITTNNTRAPVLLRFRGADLYFETGENSGAIILHRLPVTTGDVNGKTVKWTILIEGNTVRVCKDNIPLSFVDGNTPTKPIDKTDFRNISTITMGGWGGGGQSSPRYFSSVEYVKGIRLPE